MQCDVLKQREKFGRRISWTWSHSQSSTQDFTTIISCTFFISISLFTFSPLVQPRRGNNNYEVLLFPLFFLCFPFFSLFQFIHAIEKRHFWLVYAEMRAYLEVFWCELSRLLVGKQITVQFRLTEAVNTALVGRFTSGWMEIMATCFFLTKNKTEAKTSQGLASCEESGIEQSEFSGLNFNQSERVGDWRLLLFLQSFKIKLNSFSWLRF